MQSGQEECRSSTAPGKGSWLCCGGKFLSFHFSLWTALTSSLKSSSITRETRLYNLYNLTDLKAWSPKPQTQIPNSTCCSSLLLCKSYKTQNSKIIWARFSSQNSEVSTWEYAIYSLKSFNALVLCPRAVKALSLPQEYQTKKTQDTAELCLHEACKPHPWIPYSNAQQWQNRGKAHSKTPVHDRTS